MLNHALDRAKLCTLTCGISHWTRWTMSNQLGTGQEEDRQQKHQSHAQLGECCLLPIGSIAGSIAHSFPEQPIVISVGSNLNLWRCQSFTMYRNVSPCIKIKHYMMRAIFLQRGQRSYRIRVYRIISDPMSVTVKRLVTLIYTHLHMFAPSLPQTTLT